MKAAGLDYFGQHIDHNEYKLETTGARSDELAKLVNELSLGVMTSPDHVENRSEVAKMLMTEPECISKLMERRIRNTSGFLFGVDDYKSEHVFTDLLLVIALQEQGYTFEDFNVDVSYLVGQEPNIVDLDGMLKYYGDGLKESYNKGKDIRIPNPFDLSQMIPADKLVEAIRRRQVELNGSRKTEEPQEKTM